MRPARSLCVLALAAGLAIGIGCGSSDGTISSGSAEQLQERLDKVRASFDEGRCSAAAEQAEGLRSRVDALDAPQRLRDNLRDGIQRLERAVAAQCQDATPIETATTETVTQPTVTITTPTTTTPTTPTQTTETTPTVPSETTPTDPTGGVQPEEQQGAGDGEFDGE